MNRQAIKACDELVRRNVCAWVHPEEIVLCIGGRLNANAPAIDVILGIADLIVVVVDMHLTKTDTRRPLAERGLDR